MRPLWLALGWLLVLAVVFLSLVPEPPTVAVPGGDKLGHVLAYALLMWWFGQLYARPRRPWIALALLALGATLEAVQPLTPTRGFEYLDLLANAAGIACGWALGATRLGGTLAALEQCIQRRLS